MIWFAQDITVPAELANGNAQQILAWVVGGLILLYGATVTYLVNALQKLQLRLDTETRERREESLRLAAEQKDIYRESMTAMNAFTNALEANTQAVIDYMSDED